MNSTTYDAGTSPFLMPAFDNTRVSFKIPDIPGILPGGASADIQRTTGTGAAGVAAATGMNISLPLLLIIVVLLILVLRR